MESWDHIILPTLSILFPYLQTLNKVFYFNNDEKEEEKTKSFKGIKFSSPLNVQASKKKYHKPFESNSWSESENLDEKELKLQPWFQSGRSKKIVMILYFIFLKTDNSLFPPLEQSLHRISNFLHKLCPWYGEGDVNPIPTLSSTGNCPKLHCLYQWTN